MARILTSASKLVLLMTFLTVNAGFLMGLLPVDQYVPIVMLVGGYYFSNANKRTDDINLTTPTA